MKQVILAICLLLLVGCTVKNIVYTKPNFTQQEWSKDYSECEVMAQRSVRPPDPFMGNPFAMVVWEQNKNKIRHHCLVGRGWIPQAEQNTQQNNT